MNSDPSKDSTRPGGSPAGRITRGLLLLLLVALFVLRLQLVARGGQFFIPDEVRYLRALRFANLLVQGHWGLALDSLIVQIEEGRLTYVADHNGFTLVALPASLLQGAVKVGLGYEFSQTFWIVAVYNAGWAMAAVWLLYALCRRLGAGEWEALLAAALLGLSATFHLYASHLVPYDISLALGLLALYLSADPRPAGWRDFLSGLATCLSFLSYNAFWQLAGIAFGTQVWFALRHGGRPARRVAVWLGAACLIPLGLLLHCWLREINPIQGYLNMVRYQNSGLFGDFDEGWLIPWLYFWHAEHVLLVLWVGLPLLAWGRRPGERVPFRLVYGLAVAGLIYVSMAACSDVLRILSVYGRMGRQLVPFLCMAGAAGFSLFVQRLARPARAYGALLLTVVLVSAVNLRPLVRQQFPLDVLRRFMGEYTNLCVRLSVRGPAQHASPELLRPARYVLTNYRALFPVRGLEPVPEGRVLFSTPHPLAYRAAHYDGFMRSERKLLREADLTIKLIDTQPDQPPDP